MNDVITIAFIIILFIIFDLVFINFFVGHKWKDTITKIQNKNKPEIRPLYAIFSYIMLIIGLILFVYLPNKDRECTELYYIAFAWGFLVYSIFDLTNLALFKDYPLQLAMIDMFWGGFVSAISVYFACLISKSLS